MQPFRGVYTAVVTPFDSTGSIDWGRYDALLDFQSEARVDGVVVGGTTGESPTLGADEMDRLVERALDRLPSSIDLVVGVGRSSRTKTEVLLTRAVELGCSSIMLVDPAYNAPSSTEIRREYLGPLIARYPSVRFLSYVVPGRTGTRLLPEDLALAHRSYPNLLGVKDATGEEAYGLRVRELLPEPFSLLSGDDGRAVTMIEDPRIRADGLVSVVSNLLPRFVTRIVREARATSIGSTPSEASVLRRVGGWVSFTHRESTPLGPVDLRIRNPVPLKAIGAMVGASLGRCRPPLGRLPPGAFEWLSHEVERLDREVPELFEPARQALGGPKDLGAGSEPVRQEWAYAEY
jgi:4-hydroxy-tetrahydrodipicolinate synthase